ncbi:MAG: hypothetical protein ACFE0S_00405 [Rhodospirillales bacterium]
MTTLSTDQEEIAPRASTVLTDLVQHLELETFDAENCAALEKKCGITFTGATREGDDAEEITNAIEDGAERISAYVEQNIEFAEARQARIRNLEDSDESPRPTYAVLRSSAGSGKTFATIRKLIERLRGNMVVSFFLPTTEMLEQVKADLMGAGADKTANLVTRQSKAMLGCLRKDDIEILQSADTAISTEPLCRGKNSDGEEAFCEHMHHCPAYAAVQALKKEAADDVYPDGWIENLQPADRDIARDTKASYQAQLYAFEERPTILLSVHRYLDSAVKPVRLQEEAALAIIDESPFTNLAFSYELPVKLFADEKGASASRRLNVAITKDSPDARADMDAVADVRQASAEVITKVLRRLGDASAHQVLAAIFKGMEKDERFKLRTRDEVKAEYDAAVDELNQVQDQIEKLEEGGKEVSSVLKFDRTRLRRLVVDLQTELFVVASQEDLTTRKPDEKEQLQILKNLWLFQTKISGSHREYERQFRQTTHLSPDTTSAKIAKLTEETLPPALGAEMALIRLLEEAVKQMYPAIVESENKWGVTPETNWRELRTYTGPRAHDAVLPYGAESVIRCESIGDDKKKTEAICFGKLRPISTASSNILFLDGSADFALTEIAMNATHEPGLEPLQVDLPLNVRCVYSHKAVTKGKINGDDNDPVAVMRKTGIFRTVSHFYELGSEVVRNLDNPARRNLLGVIGPKDLIDRARVNLAPGAGVETYLLPETLKDLHDRDPNLDNFMHFGATRGRNTMSDFGGLLVVGKVEPAVHTVKSLADAFWAAATPAQLEALGPRQTVKAKKARGAAVADYEDRLRNRTRSHKMRNGITVNLQTPYYPDLLLTKVHSQIREEELVQAIGRLRGTRETSPDIRKWPVIFILSNVLVDLPGLKIDAVIDQQVIYKHAAIWRATLETGGFTQKTVFEDGVFAHLRGAEKFDASRVRVILREMGFQDNNAGTGYALFRVKVPGRKGRQPKVYIRDNIVDVDTAVRLTAEKHGLDPSVIEYTAVDARAEEMLAAYQEIETIEELDVVSELDYQWQKDNARRRARGADMGISADIRNKVRMDRLSEVVDVSTPELSPN